jgi:hypothetical protein
VTNIVLFKVRVSTGLIYIFNLFKASRNLSETLASVCDYHAHAAPSSCISKTLRDRLGLLAATGLQQLGCSLIMSEMVDLPMNVGLGIATKTKR